MSFYRATITAPQWVVDAGLAYDGEIQTQLFEDKQSALDFAATGDNPTIEKVDAESDDELFILGP